MKLIHILIYLSLAISINAEIHKEPIDESYNNTPHAGNGDIKVFIELSENKILFNNNTIELTEFKKHLIEFTKDVHVNVKTSKNLNSQSLIDVLEILAKNQYKNISVGNTK